MRFLRFIKQEIDHTSAYIIPADQELALPLRKGEGFFLASLVVSLIARSAYSTLRFELHNKLGSVASIIEDLLEATKLRFWTLCSH